MPLIIARQWQEFFAPEIKKLYFKQLHRRLVSLYRQSTCYPPLEQIFRVFQLIAPHQVKVVIIGQDPYYQPRQADGLAFSNGNPQGRLPKSLYNIFRELKQDLQIDHFHNGSLVGWVRSGVLLVNTIWSVGAGQPASHAGLGWQQFTFNLLTYIVARFHHGKTKLIMVGWGAKAQKIIKQFSHGNVITIFAAHPSPLSYHRFQNSRPFSRINHHLLTMHETPIDWSS